MLSADPDDLLARKLAALPSPRAPQTLLPRVMAAAEQWSRRPWYTRAWLTWPIGLQFVSLAVLALLLVGGAVVIPIIRLELADAARRVAAGQLMEILEPVLRAGATLNACIVLWRALIEPLAAYAFVLAALSCLVCAAFATALSRAPFGRS
jgi:hypothetical protein